MSAKEDKQLANKWDTQNAFDSVRRETTAQIVKNLLLSTNFSVEKIASLAVVPVDFVLKIKAELKVK